MLLVGAFKLSLLASLTELTRRVYLLVQGMGVVLNIAVDEQDRVTHLGNLIDGCRSPVGLILKRMTGRDLMKQH